MLGIDTSSQRARQKYGAVALLDGGLVGQATKLGSCVLILLLDFLLYFVLNFALVWCFVMIIFCG